MSIKGSFTLHRNVMKLPHLQFQDIAFPVCPFIVGNDPRVLGTSSISLDFRHYLNLRRHLMII